MPTELIVMLTMRDADDVVQRTLAEISFPQSLRSVAAQADRGSPHSRHACDLSLFLIDA
jgi:hypothetical protein